MVVLRNTSETWRVNKTHCKGNKNTEEATLEWERQRQKGGERHLLSTKFVRPVWPAHPWMIYCLMLCLALSVVAGPPALYKFVEIYSAYVYKAPSASKASSCCAVVHNVMNARALWGDSWILNMFANTSNPTLHLQ